MKVRLGSQTGIGLPRNLTGWHLTGLGLILLILLTVVLVLSWGDTLSFPKVLDKEIPTRIVTLNAELQDELESGRISASPSNSSRDIASLSAR